MKLVSSQTRFWFVSVVHRGPSVQAERDGGGGVRQITVACNAGAARDHIICTIHPSTTINFSSNCAYALLDPTIEATAIDTPEPLHALTFSWSQASYRCSARPRRMTSFTSCNANCVSSQLRTPARVTKVVLPPISLARNTR